MDSSLLAITDKLLAKCSFNAEPADIIPLAGDASGRQFFRILLPTTPFKQAILMLVKDLKGPVVNSKTFINPNDVFLELSPFLNKNGFRVPQIYAFDETAVLLEDAGDMPLWHFTFNKISPAEEDLIKNQGSDFITPLYKKAIDALIRLQNITPDSSLRACQRSMEFEQYRTESQRFIDFYLKVHNYPKTLQAETEAELNNLCEAVASHPRSLMHRDYMPWNIHVLPDMEIMTIDYQDMLVGSAAYDIVSLIHDRDADKQLGDKICKTLVDYFFSKCQTFHNKEFYHEVLAQRYLRLAGQFNHLSNTLSKPVYRSWVPGCLTGIGRSLACLPQFSKLADILSSVPEIKAGLNDPWSF